MQITVWDDFNLLGICIFAAFPFPGDRAQKKNPSKEHGCVRSNVFGIGPVSLGICLYFR